MKPFEWSLSSLLDRFGLRRPVSKPVPKDEDRSESLPPTIPLWRRRMVARVVLYPAPGPTAAVKGPITVAKVMRPGDDGPGIVEIVHIHVHPKEWATLDEALLVRIADGLRVELVDLLEGVKDLCGGRL